MKILSGDKAQKAEWYMYQAAEVAKWASCERSKCWCLIVKNGEIIGKGFNSPANNLEAQRRCSCEKDTYHKKVTDKTCCIHAEQRAMFDALRNHPKELIWADLYFIRLDKEGKLAKAGQPYCTICSKMALDLGIKNFHLRHEEGIASYPCDEYNTLSYQYH